MKSITQLFFLLALSIPSNAQSNVVNDQLEFNALKALWERTHGSSWTNNTGWPKHNNWPSIATAAQMSTWYGVTVVNGDIRELKLNNNNLNGEIPEEIGRLAKLESLSLQKNNLSGSIPSQIGSLTNLLYFYVGDNQLTGTIPASFSTSMRMVVFDVHSNQLSGTVPAIFSRMNYLNTLYLNKNRFSGTLPPLRGQTIDVSDNMLTGNFPAVDGSFVVTILAANNALTSLPSNADALMPLLRVDFGNNELTSVPSSFAARPAKSNTQLVLVNNRLDFSVLDMLPGFKSTSSLFPQKSIKDQVSQIVEPGKPLILNARDQGSASTTWEKQSAGGQWSSVGNGSTYRKDVFTKSDEGIYRWRSMSRVFPSAFIQSEPIQVKCAMRFTLDNWCFQYKYDGRQRMTHKKVPGADWIYMVYDNRNRLVMTQDGEQRSMNRWTVNKYDALNRPTITGVYTHHQTISQQEMERLVLTGDVQLSQLDITKVVYYDDYSFAASSPELSFKMDELRDQSGNSLRVKGLITGMKLKVLEAPAPYYLTSANYYDDRGRVIQTVSENYDAGIDRTTNVYDFVGNVVSTRTTHSVNNISWKNVNSIQVEGNCISRVPGNSNSAGAQSIQSLSADEDGWVEATVPETNTWRFFGLADTDPDVLPGSIDYAFYLYGPSLSIFENGVFKYSVPGGETPGDKLRISRTGTTIRYYKNGTLVYTSSIASKTTLYADVSMQTNNARIFNLNLSNGRSTQSTLRIFEYDHGGRLLTTKHSVDGGDTIVLLKNEYNELGQLVDKNLYSNDNRSFFEKVGYNYNIRGWLTAINGLFPMNLFYDSLYNGNISRMTFRDNFTYRFKYDPMRRLTSATQATKSFQESGITYDLNGNIKTLSRTDVSGKAIDILKYDYGQDEMRGNVLKRVTDEGTQSGFSDAPAFGDDYSHDKNGNVTSDKNKGIVSVNYNMLNLPISIVKSTGESMLYYYDASGRKLSQVVRDASGVQMKKTDYHGDYIYENDTLKFVNHEEGRVLINASKPEYQYHLKDHLGNVRMTITTKKEKDLSTADFESGSADFLNYKDAVKVNASVFDHTNIGPTYYSERLNGTDGERLGLAKSLRVMPGDTIKMKVFAKYLNPDSTSLTPGMMALMSSIVPGVWPKDLVKDGGLVSGGGGLFFLPWYLLTPGTENSNGAPMAYLNWLIFDRDYVLKDGGSVQITTAAEEHGENTIHEELSKQLLIKDAGFVYVYLSNDHYAITGKRIDVYFDDFTVEHIKGPIVQSQDYYPFGMTFNEFKREKSMVNKYQYNGKEKVDELNIGWLDYGARLYMPEIARWGVVDPRSEKYLNSSPYNYVLGNPISNIDPRGDTVTVQVTNTVVGKTNINLYSSSEVSGKNAVAQETTEVNVYEVNVSNEEGETATFYYTRDAYRKDASNPSADAKDLTFDVRQDGDSFQGLVKSRWNKTDNVLELRKLDDASNQSVDAMKGGVDATRSAIQFHAKGATDGCLMAVGSGQFNSTAEGATINTTNLGTTSKGSQANFMEKVKDFRQADVDAGKSNFIKVTFQKNN